MSSPLTRRNTSLSNNLVIVGCGPDSCLALRYLAQHTLNARRSWLISYTSYFLTSLLNPAKVFQSKSTPLAEFKLLSVIVF